MVGADAPGGAPARGDGDGADDGGAPVTHEEEDDERGEDGAEDQVELHFVEGGVYPKPYPVTAEFKRTGDLMPVMTKFARIAPAGLARYRGANFGEDYRGNLFSAQFNPHRVQRHVLTRERAHRGCDLTVECKRFARSFKAIACAVPELGHFDATLWKILLADADEDIRRAGVATLPEALRLAPGTEVARVGSAEWAVSVRGFNDNYLDAILS